MASRKTTFGAPESFFFRPDPRLGNKTLVEAPEIGIKEKNFLSPRKFFFRPKSFSPAPIPQGSLLAHLGTAGLILKAQAHTAVIVRTAVIPKAIAQCYHVSLLVCLGWDNYKRTCRAGSHQGPRWNLVGGFNPSEKILVKMGIFPN